MAPSRSRLALCLRFLFLCAMVVHQLPLSARAGDPDILTDFVVPHATDPSLINGTFFTYTRLITSISGDSAKFTVSKATAAEYPALLGQSVSYAALVYGPGTVNPPHIHPRASELLCVVQGPLLVGLIDAERNGTVYTQTLESGDMFVFPKGMVHFQLNNGTDVARAFSAFGSASPGTISLPLTLFGTGIDDAVLEKSLHTDKDTVEALKHDEQPPAAAPGPTAMPPSSSAASVGVGVGVGAALLSRSAMMLLCFVAAFFVL